MAEPLKNKYGPEIPRKIESMISEVHPTFNADSFLQQALLGYDDLDLTPRARQIAEAMHAHLPDDYDEAMDILLRSLGPKLDTTDEFGMAVFLYLPHILFIAEYGVDHFETSMRAQYELTQRFTAEFSIRFYIEKYPEKTMSRLREWTSDPSAHVRRLVSEGTRTRLPWASRLRDFQKDPQPVIELLELLKDDPELYVRRSVANNLNDIGKDHPELLVDIARRWMKDSSEERQWLIRHALRSAVKRGDRGALDVLGYGTAEDVVVSEATIAPQTPRVGEKVTLAFELHNHGEEKERMMVDFRIHYVKANGKTSPKVFKLKSVELAPGEKVRLDKSVSLKEMTTRKHYLGVHEVDVIVNGRIIAVGSFELTAKV